MFIDVDYDKRKKGYKINLAKPNQQTIASVSEAYGANYSIKLGNINEVTFNVPYFIDKLDKRVKNENIELIKEKMYTKISYNNNDEWMVIDTIEDVGNGDEKYMTVTAFTNVYETSNRKINELNLEVVNPEEYYDAVLNDVAWSIGTIDPLFKDIYRSVELSNTTVLEAIITGAETFGAVLDFDTENKKINLIDIDSRAKYRGLNINYSNFLQSINRKRSVDEMTTRLYVYGSEDLSIENVNPTGMRYLEDFTYFLYPFERDESKNVIKSSHYMSDELAHAILDKNELSKEYQPQIKAMQEEIDEETIEYINETTLLNELRFDETSISGLLDIAKATEDNDLILQRQSELAEIKTKISIKELTVDHISATIEDLERQIAQLQSQISVTSFSKELYDELSMYIIESEFRDDRYIDEEELYRDALKKFEESKSPNIVIEASIDNIIDSLEEDYYSDKVVLGDIARVTDKEMSVEMKSLITELSFDLDNNTCDVTIANGDIEKDGYDRILSVLYDTQSTTTMLENNKHKWDTVTDVKTEVDLIRDSEIDATRNRIKAGFRESVTIEDRGIILSNPDFPGEIVIMQAGVIALSTDGGENWSTSITPRGVMAETIIGKLVASNNLIVTNDSGSFRIDSDGLTVDMDSIKIMSGEGDTPENIVDSWNKMLITMDEFADDGKLNEYEKNQIARQWNSIAIAHSSMVEAIQNAYGPETPEKQYPIEYEEYMESYEGLRRYLNDEIQSDGHTILDPLHRSETTNIDSDKYNKLVSDYEVSKDRFQTVIPLDFSQTFIEQTRKEISLNYVKNGEVATKLNLSEEGVRIDGRLLEINSETHFNDDLVMNAGLIRSKDNAINIDLNTGEINLARPLTINSVPVATEGYVEESLADAIKNIDVEYGITSDKDTAPTDWSTTPPAWQDGKYIWSRTLTVYKNGNTEITEPVNITGATGSSGGAGQDGRSVKSIQEQYYLSTSPVDLENGSWLDNPPEWEKDKYIWTRSVITYENPSGVDRTDPVSISGQQGPKGEDGSDGKDAPIVKLSGKTQIIKVNENGQTTPSANFTVAGSSVNTVITTWRYSVDGGDFVVSLPIGVTRSGATITVNPNSVEFDTLTIRASDGRVSDDFTIARAVDGATGEDAYTIILTNESHTFAGNVLHAVPSSTTTDIIAYKGNVRVPVTIDSVTGMPTGMSNSISSNGTTNTRITFSVTDELVDESGTVKLNLVVNGNHITKEFSFSVAYKGERGDKGDKGEQGLRGPAGANGQSQYVHMRYSANSNGSGFVPTPNNNTKYIGIAVTPSSTAPTDASSYTWSKFIGEDGDRGIQGPKGTDGKTTYTWVKYADDVDGNGISDSPSGKMFIGLAFNKETESESNNPNDYQWSAMYDEEAFKGIGLADKTEVLSGTEIYTDKADDSVVHVEIDGKSYQYSKDDSKNLAPHPEHWVFRGGATYDETSNIMTLPIGAEIEFWVRWDESTANPRLSFDTISGSGFLWNTTYFAEDKKTPVLNDGGTHSSNGSLPKWSSNPTRYVHTSPRINNNTKWIRMVFSGHEKYTLSTVKIKNIMVVSGSSTEYEPPAPTPDYPIEIHSVNDFDVVSQKSEGGVIDGIEVGGRNLLLNSKVIEIRNNTRYKIRRLSEEIPANSPITISIESREWLETPDVEHDTVMVSLRYSQGVGIGEASYTSVQVPIGGSITVDSSHFSYGLPVDTALFYSADHNASLNNNENYYNIKIERSTVSTDWTPAPEDITESDNHPLIDKINLLLSEPLHSVGGVKDRLFRDSDGLWKVERNIGVRALDGSERWSTYNNTYNASRFLTDIRQNYRDMPNAISTHFGGVLQSGTSSMVENQINVQMSGNTFITAQETFKDLGEFTNWLSNNNVEIYYQLEKPTIEILDQELQDKLNNLRSFQDSNYVYTIINDKTDIISEKLKPTLHATFKGGGWYSRWKAEDEFEKQQGQIDSKADQESLDEVSTELSDFQTIVASREELGEVTSALYDYIDDLSRNERNLENAKEDIDKLLTRLPIIENNLGAWVERWSFLDTYVTLGNEGLLISEMNGSTGIRISKDRIDFMDGSGEPVAYITNQVMRINRGIFVDSMQVGEHKVETIADGHTIWQWMGG